jgi:hypothetical protein
VAQPSDHWLSPPARWVLAHGEVLVPVDEPADQADQTPPDHMVPTPEDSSGDSPGATQTRPLSGLRRLWQLITGA